MAADTSTVGSRLREQRLAEGLTQSQLSDRSGIPKPTLSRYENDHVLPSLVTLRKIARALGVSEIRLVTEEQDAGALLSDALKRHGVEISSAEEAERVAVLVSQLLSAQRERLG